MQIERKSFILITGRKYCICLLPQLHQACRRLKTDDGI